jgi:hypothetical protein
MVHFQKTLEVKFWCKTLISEAAFHLHNFCVDMHDCSIVGIGNCDTEMFRPSYMEYLDPLCDKATENQNAMLCVKPFFKNQIGWSKVTTIQHHS